MSLTKKYIHKSILASLVWVECKLWREFLYDADEDDAELTIQLRRWYFFWFLFEVLEPSKV